MLYRDQLLLIDLYKTLTCVKFTCALTDYSAKVQETIIGYLWAMFYMTTLSVLGVLGCRQNDNRQKPRIIHVPCTISTLFVYVDYSKSAVEIN